jgi:hypothetical protein
MTSLRGAGEHPGRKACDPLRSPAEVVDVGVGDQDRLDLLRPPPDLTDRLLHLLDLTGVAGVDECDSFALDQDDPVHQASVDEVDAVGDRRDGHRSMQLHRTYVRSWE